MVITSNRSNGFQLRSAPAELPWIKRIPITAVRPNPANARTHSKKATRADARAWGGGHG
jgi:hypothetical protein